MDLEGITLSEISPSKKDKYHTMKANTFMWDLRNKTNKNTDSNIENKLMVTRGEVGEGMGEIGEGD